MLFLVENYSIVNSTALARSETWIVQIVDGRQWSIREIDSNMEGASCEGRRGTTSRWFEGFIEGPLHVALKTKWCASWMLCSVLFLCESSMIVVRTLFSNPQYGMFRSGSVEGEASSNNERYLFLLFWISAIIIWKVSFIYVIN